ncbi:LysR substrate-binding domain-containing protein [Sphingomonas sp.]|uniref:LysR substrate-binding domain-containing protein n=1 Tax=Sphingomonas sp. TaxID=28214 RepID=UPI003B3B223B
MTDVSTAELRALGAVAAARNFRRAAQMLGLPPSSLSYLVSSVESRLGIRIFNRTTRSVSLTEAGEHFIERLVPALAAIDAAVADVRDLRDTPSGLLKINSAEAGAEHLLPMILTYLDRYKETRVEVRIDGTAVDIVKQGCDAGVRLREHVPLDMVAIPLTAEEPMVVVAAPAYLAAHGRPARPEQLADHSCIRARLPDGAAIRWDFAHEDCEVRIDADARLTVGSSLLAAQAAVQGAGLAYLPHRAVAQALQRGELIQILGKWTPSATGLSLYYPRQKLPSAALRTFIAHIRAHVRSARQSARHERHG